MSRKILVIMGHPNKTSLCSSLANAYKQGALKAGALVKEIYITDLQFDLILHEGYNHEQKLEEDLRNAQELIKWADHLVFVYPIWWRTMPAILKGFIERVFLPDFGFRYRKDSPWVDGLLIGRSACLIVTMDTPPWYFKFIYGEPGHNAMKKGTLEFCGIKPVRVLSVGPVRMQSQSKIQKWLKKIERYGKQLK